jgi:hypothetical protein
MRAKPNNATDFTVTLPTSLVEKVVKLARDRGVTADVLTRLALEGIANFKVKYHDLNTPLQMGKYRGELTETVIRCAPDYVTWAVNNIPGFELSPEAADLLKEISRVSPLVDES